MVLDLQTYSSARSICMQCIFYILKSSIKACFLCMTVEYWQASTGYNWTWAWGMVQERADKKSRFDKSAQSRWVVELSVLYLFERRVDFCIEVFFFIGRKHDVNQGLLFFPLLRELIVNTCYCIFWSCMPIEYKFMSLILYNQQAIWWYFVMELHDENEDDFCVCVCVNLSCCLGENDDEHGDFLCRYYSNEDDFVNDCFSVVCTKMVVCSNAFPVHKHPPLFRQVGQWLRGRMTHALHEEIWGSMPQPGSSCEVVE